MRAPKKLSRFATDPIISEHVDATAHDAIVEADKAFEDAFFRGDSRALAQIFLVVLGRRSQPVPFRVTSSRQNPKKAANRREWCFRLTGSRRAV
jgi:hypothetical protein